MESAGWVRQTVFALAVVAKINAKVIVAGISPAVEHSHL